MILASATTYIFVRGDVCGLFHVKHQRCGSMVCGNYASNHSPDTRTLRDESQDSLRVIGPLRLFHVKHCVVVRRETFRYGRK
jgi:hypothetical protein